MFCPSCADEFRDGITHCPDCEVDLVPYYVTPVRPRPAASELAAKHWSLLILSFLPEVALVVVLLLVAFAAALGKL